MPFEKGNQLGAKSRLFDEALRRAIAQDDGKKIRAAAEKLLNLAADGEAWAIRELADRLDGKAIQTSNVSLVTQKAEELSDDDLNRIAAAGGSRAAKETGGASKSTRVH